MYSEEKKSRNYGSIFVYCFFCFVLIVEVARFAKPYINLQNLIETEAVVEEGFMAVGNSGNLPCGSSKPSSASVRAHDEQKLSQAVTTDTRTRPPNSYCVKFQSFVTMAKQVKENGGKYESRPFSVGGYNWYVRVDFHFKNVEKPYLIHRRYTFFFVKGYSFIY